MDNLKTQFTLTGFRESTGYRVFQFEGIAPDRTRTPYTVRADLAMARRYGIRLQELPLLCRGVLDRRDEAANNHSLTYSEEDMSQFKDAASAREEAAKHRKPPRRPATENIGNAWRAPTV
jgi:hypothetical protein